MRKPNILFFCADELTRNALGCYGASHIHSPNIDELARTGTRFACHYSNSPLCVPSRGSMITGRYVHDVGCWDNGHPYHGTPKGWAHHLRASGYRTVSVGKNHFRSLDDDNGFDLELLPMHVRWGIGDIFGMLRKEGATYRNLGSTAPDKPGDAHAVPLFGPAMMAATAGPGESNHTDYDRRITQAACSWLREQRHDKGPWALYVSFVAPHFPLTAPEEFYRLYADLSPPMPYHYTPEQRPHHPAIQNLMRIWNYDDFFDASKVAEARRAYYGLITFLDHNIGTVIKSLNEISAASDTLIAVVSDHGEMLGNKGIWSTSAMYEDSVGVPLIVSGPSFPAGRAVTTPTSNIDLAPTLVEAGCEKTSGAEWPGTSLKSLAQSPDNPDRVVFSEYHAGGSDTAFYMVRKGRFKYIAYVGYPSELFDLSSDPQEGRDLAQDPRYASVVQEFDAELRRIVDPDAANAAAFASQTATIDKHGGRDAVRRRGHPGEHSLDRKLGIE